MGDATGKRSEALELLGLEELVLKAAAALLVPQPLGYVLLKLNLERDAPVRPVDRGNRRPDMENTTVLFPVCELTVP